MSESFEEVAISGFMKHNGGLQFRKISESEYQFRATIQPCHLNPSGITHGGFIMSLLDSGMGIAAYRSLPDKTRIATISLDAKFISASKENDILLGNARVLRKTRSLVFMQGEINCRGNLVATAEGIWKVI